MKKHSNYLVFKIARSDFDDDYDALFEFNHDFISGCIAKLRDLGWIRPPPKGPGEAGLAGIGLSLVMVIGTVVFCLLEDWDILQSLYFCFVTLTTIGFSDFVPLGAAGKTFFVFFIFTGLGFCAQFIQMLITEV